MELSECIHKLVNQNTINNITVKELQNILKLIAIQAEKSNNLKAIAEENNCDPGIFKEVYISILSLMAEAAKYDYSVEKFNSGLMFNTKIYISHIEVLSKAYELHQNSIRSSLQVIGNNAPHIIDVKWKLIHYKNAKQRGPWYNITLIVIRHDNLRSLSFTCHILQLQEIILKIKDAICHMEKLSI